MVNPQGVPVLSLGHIKHSIFGCSVSQTGYSIVDGLELLLVSAFIPKSAALNGTRWEQVDRLIRLVLVANLDLGHFHLSLPAPTLRALFFLGGDKPGME